MAQKQNLLPFKAGSDRRIQPVTTLTYTLNSNLTCTLPKVGFVTKILAYVNLTLATSGTVTPTRDGIYAFIPRVTTSINSGMGLLVDARSFALNAFAPVWNGLNTSNGLGIGSTVAPFWQTSGVTNGSTVQFLIEIPVSANTRSAYDVGCMNVQNQNLQFTLNMQTATAATDYGTNMTGVSGTVEVYYEYAEAVDKRKVEFPEPLVFTYQENFYPITANGVNTFTIPKRGTATAFCLDVIYNSVRNTTSLTSVDVVFNRTDRMYSVRSWLLDYWARSTYGFQPIGGTYVFPFGAWGDAVGTMSWDGFIPVNKYSTTDINTTTNGVVGGLTGVFIGVPTIQPLVLDPGFMEGGV